VAGIGDPLGWIVDGGGGASMQSPDKSGVMIGIGSVALFLGVSEKQIYNFLKWGMPGSKINGIWYFHKLNVEKWWLGATAKATRLDPDELREAME
jgi:hypothetical protein